MGGDQPDWTEIGRVPTGGNKRRGPDARAPDWHNDPAKYAAKLEQDKRERGELVVAVGPYCVPCGKRFAKQSVYDAHLAGKKHLAALQRMGRHEEAMVCQLDIEAKRRKLDAAEEARQAAAAPSSAAAAAPSAGGAPMGGAGTSTLDTEDPAEAARRAADREEKLRQRAMLPMPATVSASSVYALEDEDGAAAAVPPTITPTSKATTFELASAASGVGASFSYTSGRQDGINGAVEPNRHTTATIAAEHRRLAVPSADWFNPAAPAAKDCEDVRTYDR